MTLPQALSRTTSFARTSRAQPAKLHRAMYKSNPERGSSTPTVDSVALAESLRPTSLTGTTLSQRLSSPNSPTKITKAGTFLFRSEWAETMSQADLGGHVFLVAINEQRQDR